MPQSILQYFLSSWVKNIGGSTKPRLKKSFYCYERPYRWRRCTTYFNAKCTLLVLEFNEMCPDLKVTSKAAESESMKGIQDKALLVPDSFGVSGRA